MSENYFCYLPKQYRQGNFRASCVYASVTNCLRIVGLWDKADKFWAAYRGDPNGENEWGISEKLDRFGVKHMVTHDEQSLINALKAGRGCAVTWGGAHCVTLVGRINGYAYILDNQGNQYRIRTWQKFMQGYKSSGGWAVIILDGQAPNAVEQKNLDGFDD